MTLLPTLPVRPDVRLPEARARTVLPRGFSLVELVVVVVIIGLIAAIAIPRFGRASANAGDAALRADLKLLRDAIELYAADHNDTYPAYRPAGADALHASSAAFERQMTWYTAPGGAAKRVPDADHYLGPYLRKMPVLPVCANKGCD